MSSTVLDAADVVVPDPRDERRRARAQARAAERAIPPRRDESFAHLDLAGLRNHRHELVIEEETVSYWRRLLQARLDIVRAGARVAPLDPARLPSVLSGERVDAVRTSMMSLTGGEGVPTLPDLARLWSTCPSDAASRARHEEELEAAEAELSAHRSALHRRLDATTAELIARYHEDPSACLVALPLPREER